MDEGEAQEENHLEPVEPPQRMPTLKGERALTSRLRGELTSPKNNRMRGWLEGWPGGSTASHGSRRWFGRLEQEDQRWKKHDGRWMDIQQSLLCVD